ncbi:hypothetical protein DPMN_127997 [Dreissena polymorpha]|uniref:Uncharacterized protein n=1 Tax=Dreissena polymorpha TaxID=45954 RepID=A0A9D4GYQ3_DREPO|nr:hypothetical protein DPMN_127997 [Dreissena polymorpha]
MSPNVDPVSLTANQSAQFTCTSDFGRPTPSVYWFIDDTTNKESVINITILSVITTVSENATISTLTFMPLKTYHNLRLYCSGNNGGPTVSSTLKPLLNILFGPTHPEFNYNGSIVTGSLAVSSGKSFPLTCKSNGNPHPSFTWTYPGGTATGENLVISRMDQQHDGKYTCSSRNTMTPSMGSIRSETTYSSISVQVNVPITHVEMVNPASNMVFIKDHDSTTLECKTSPGKPLAIIKWYKDNRTPENNIDDVETYSSNVQSFPDGVIKSVLNYTATRGDEDMRLYCTGNNIGQTLTSSRHAKLIIASSPDVPSSVAVTKVASTSVRVSLRNLSTGHMLQWFTIKVKEEDSEWIEQSVLAAFFNLSSSDVYFELTMLEQSTQYSIRVYAENILGQSGPSDIVSFKTLSTDASDSPSTSPQSFNVGAISGGVVGGVILEFFIGILGLWIIMNRRTNSQGGIQPRPKITK